VLAGTRSYEPEDSRLKVKVIGANSWSHDKNKSSAATAGVADRA